MYLGGYVHLSVNVFHLWNFSIDLLGIVSSCLHAVKQMLFLCLPVSSTQSLYAYISNGTPSNSQKLLIVEKITVRYWNIEYIKIWIF